MVIGFTAPSARRMFRHLNPLRVPIAACGGQFQLNDTMKKIPLNNDLFALVGDEDFDRANVHKWTAVSNDRGRHHAAACKERDDTGKRTTLYLHRLIVGATRDQRVMARDGNLLHCWKSNLYIPSPDNQLDHERIPKAPASDDTVWRQFAAAALTGLLSNPDGFSADCCKSAAELADNMIAIRRAKLDALMQPEPPTQQP